MLKRANGFISDNRKFIPVAATALLVVVAYGVGSIYFQGMRTPQVFLNLFRNSSFHLISAVGMTLVILSGGMDLSVSGIVALTTVVSAALLREGWNPWLVILLVLVMGMVLGFTMGSFIVYLKVQPFIATLAGMWFGRGMSYFISDNAITIDHPTFKILGQTKLLIPGLKELADLQGTPPPYITIPVVVAFVVFFIAIYVAHYTRFGRTIYAIGGDEQSARLMGLPVERTLLTVYTLNGFCSALAGLAWCLFVSSGHGAYAPGFEMDVIASVVIGGTLLTGGSGYVVGTLFGVMVFAITQALIQFIGSLSSWWTKIVIGVLMLMFIGVQAMLANRKVGDGALVKQILRPGRRRLAYAFGAVVVVAVLAVALLPGFRGHAVSGNGSQTACQVQPFRKDEAARLVEEGAVIVYHRLAGPACIDEMYAIYPDGRIWANDGEHIVETTVSPGEVETLLTTIVEDYDWYSNEIRDSYHMPCRQCFAHYVIVADEGREKGATAVDGGVNMPPPYGFTLAVLRAFITKGSPAP